MTVVRVNHAHELGTEAHQGLAMLAAIRRYHGHLDTAVKMRRLVDAIAADLRGRAGGAGVLDRADVERQLSRMVEEARWAALQLGRRRGSRR